jgi:hypothetical protein
LSWTEKLGRINVNEKVESLQLKTIESELARFFGKVKLWENGAEVLELMEIEKLRWLTIMEAKLH